MSSSLCFLPPAHPVNYSQVNLPKASPDLILCSFATGGGSSHLFGHASGPDGPQGPGLAGFVSHTPHPVLVFLDYTFGSLLSFLCLCCCLFIENSLPPLPHLTCACLKAFLDPARKAFSLLSIHHILLMTFFCLTLCYLHTSFFSCVSFEVNEQAPRSPLLPAASRSWSDSQSLFAGAPEG